MVAVNDASAAPFAEQGVTGDDSARTASCVAVEVRKNAEASIWYCAELRDLTGKNAVVSFADNVWPTREVPCSSVRFAPTASQLEEWEDEEIKEGDVVECRVAATARNPIGWALGHVVAVEDGGMIRVSLNASRGMMLPAEMIRPASRAPTVDPSEFKRQAVSIEPVLRPWLSTTDARGCLEQLQVVAGLLVAGAGSGTRGVGLPALDGDVAQFDAVVLIGNESACHCGQMLLRIHILHQREVEAFLERRRQKLKLLSERLEVPTEEKIVAFEVSPDLIGRTIGKGGERSRRIEEAHGVEIRVVDGTTASSSRVIRVHGPTEEAVQAARVELELFQQDYTVDEERVGWMLGKGHREVQDICSKVGLAYAKWTGTALELCGSQQAIDDAVMLLDSHNEYFYVYKEMERQQEEIKRSFEALDEAAENAGLMSSRRRSARSKGPSTTGAAARSVSRRRAAPEAGDAGQSEDRPREAQGPAGKTGQ